MDLIGGGVDDGVERRTIVSPNVATAVIIDPTLSHFCRHSEQDSWFNVEASRQCANVVHRQAALAAKEFRAKRSVAGI